MCRPTRKRCSCTRTHVGPDLQLRSETTRPEVTCFFGSVGSWLVCRPRLLGIRAAGLACLPWDQRSRQWQARVQCAAGWDPQHRARVLLELDERADQQGAPVEDRYGPESARDVDPGRPFDLLPMYLGFTCFMDDMGTPADDSDDECDENGLQTPLR